MKYMDFCAQMLYHIPEDIPFFPKRSLTKMKLIPLPDLARLPLSFSDLEIFPAVWVERKRFLGYRETPRPAAALFLILTDIRAVFRTEDGRITEAKQGDVVYIPGGIRYRADFTGGRPETLIDTYTVNFRLFDADGEEVAPFRHITVAAENRGALEKHFRALSEAVHGGDNRIRAYAAFYSLLDAVISAADQNTDESYPIRRGADALCHEWNLNERMEKYASLSGVSIGYFYRLFRRRFGMSPVEYRNHLRISNAEAILRNTRMSIREISSTVGFDDPFYFCRIFKKVTGVSPSSFRGNFEGERKG